jgi:dihydroorotase
MLARQFPKLKIIYEHISDGRGLRLVEEHENIFATISLHHMTLTRDDLMGEKLNPHLFCKPVIKTAKDAETLRSFALKAHPKVCFGSDSAPHPRVAKESGSAPAGIFTAPILLPALVELFEKHDRLDNLQKFISDNAQRIYNVSPPKKSVKLQKIAMQVPESIKGQNAEVVPMMAGKNISWSIESIV